eukprot:CAMPEP_0202492340 /NCGR_PEP_ID=MMETSP1361-20130828/9092_1 /ASSEMBLY_ACC=CAM_ASM_000849 /TAXON_ID=210615 /ORGANISM="Staurosira complex sp., Strain CCMP2646" /LENGTH=565 /DNA_ID=CAMNT_0049122535 /DNA_START=267 /DNA_END=1964 /DNA_ORIENTATION=+
MTSVEQFFQAWNRQDIVVAVNQFAPDCIYEDGTYYSPLKGKRAIQRELLLRCDATAEPVLYIVDDLAIPPAKDKVGVKYHMERNGVILPNSRHCAFYTINTLTGLSESCFDVVEPAQKTGEANLAVLNAASKIIGKGGKGDDSSILPDETSTGETVDGNWWSTLLNGSYTPSNKGSSSLSLAEQYFDAWSKRDMDTAVNLFTEDCCYEDTVFPKPFSGKQNLKEHLLLCSDAFPPTFKFIVDDVADGGDTIAAKWHVENDGKEMPFTRGVSIYKTKGNLIQEGFDEIESAVFKLGAFDLFLTSMKTKLKEEPVRWIPIISWVAYTYIVFLSNGILPGANALQLEQRTWEEVRDLSLNFFLVSPILNLPFSPTVHPILEGVFNLLLSWAALFAGFFSDERDDKPNLLPIVPTVVGMQFLTSAFLLPYLATRATEKKNVQVFKEDLSTPARIVDSPFALGPLLGFVGTGSIAWGALARQADFGGWSERVTSFWQLMSIDRVGSSFLVDLAIFALFQGWLVDDDMRRRGICVDKGEEAILRNVAKFVPFFGMAFYMIRRPTVPPRNEK